MTLSDFKDKHVGQRAFVIGKGPSLDTVETIRNDLWGGVILCLNESIHKIESLNISVPTYVVQQDSELKTRCNPKNPAVVHFMNQWQIIPVTYCPRYVDPSPWDPSAVMYKPNFFGESITSLSGVMALHIAKFMGIKTVTFCCFDALENDYNGKISYADCIGIQKDGNHRGHNKLIIATAHQMMDSVKTLHPTVAKVHK